VSWLREEFREELVRGSRCACPKTAGTCQELLKIETALWTFVRVPGIDLTNNAAEVRLVGQKSSTQDVWRIGPGAVRALFSQPQNLIPVSV